VPVKQKCVQVPNSENTKNALKGCGTVSPQVLVTPQSTYGILYPIPCSGGELLAFACGTGICPWGSDTVIVIVENVLECLAP